MHLIIYVYTVVHRYEMCYMHNLIITPVLNEFNNSKINGDYIIIIPYSINKTFKGQNVCSFFLNHKCFAANFWKQAHG